MTKFTICIMNDREISEHERRVCESKEKHIHTHTNMKYVDIHAMSTHMLLYAYTLFSIPWQFKQSDIFT